MKHHVHLIEAVAAAALADLRSRDSARESARAIVMRHRTTEAGPIAGKRRKLKGWQRFDGRSYRARGRQR